jgi:glycosyltransferase involved in cell wall biosynthesis
MTVRGTARPYFAPAPDPGIEPGPVPSFSIIIPAYQTAGFIAEAVDSALGQTLEPREVIICDDGSTDDLEAALAPFRERITFLRRPHRGAGAARNEAVRVASGDFVVMLDADDRYEAERLSALGELAALRPDLDIVSTDAYYEVGNSLNGRFHEFTPFASEQQRLEILDRCFVAWPALRRTRVLEVGGFDESDEVAPGEDWELFIRLILDGSKAGIVNQPLMRYRKHSASATANRARDLSARVAILEKTRLDPTLSPDERRFLKECLVRARSRAVLLDASGLAAARRRGRRGLLALAASSAVPPTTRLTLAAAAFAPAGTSRILGWKERRVARSRARRPVPAHPSQRAVTPTRVLKQG